MATPACFRLCKSRARMIVLCVCFAFVHTQVHVRKQRRVRLQLQMANWSCTAPRELPGLPLSCLFVCVCCVLMLCAAQPVYSGSTKSFFGSTLLTGTLLAKMEWLIGLAEAVMLADNALRASIVSPATFWHEKEIVAPVRFRGRWCVVCLFGACFICITGFMSRLSPTSTPLRSAMPYPGIG